MINVWEFSPVASQNDAAPPDGAPEGMARSAVNDTLREMYAAIARFRDDISGVKPANVILTVTGTSSAYLLATNQAPVTLTNGFTVKFTVGAALTNPGSVTLNVDGTGAKTIQGIAGTNLVGGELVAGSTYTVTFHQPSNAFILHNFFRGAGVPAFPLGTRMLFQQTAVPPGWVKDTSGLTVNKALRLTNGTVGVGGSTVFTSIFGPRTILRANLPIFNLPHTLTMPSHLHSDNFTLPNHLHDDSFALSGSQVGGIARDPTFAVRGTSAPNSSTVVSVTTTTLTLTGGVGSVTSNPAIVGQVLGPTSFPNINGLVPSGGSGLAMDFDVAYVDVVIGVKS